MILFLKFQNMLQDVHLEQEVPKKKLTVDSFYTMILNEKLDKQAYHCVNRFSQIIFY